MQVSNKNKAKIKTAQKCRCVVWLTVIADVQTRKKQTLNQKIKYEKYQTLIPMTNHHNHPHHPRKKKKERKKSQWPILIASTYQTAGDHAGRETVMQITSWAFFHIFLLQFFFLLFQFIWVYRD